MNEMPKLVLLVRALPRDPASLAVCPPQSRIDATFDVDGCDEDIGDLVVALGVAGFASEHNADLPELRGQRGIEDRLQPRVRHVGCSLVRDRGRCLGWNQVCSAAALAGMAALDFFKLLTMIVISGTSSRGSVPFKG